MEMEELLAEIQSLKADLTELKDLVHKGIIEPIEKDYNDKKYKEATDIWREHFKDKLSPYEARLKATEGDDFDLFNASYDAWNETDADPDEWVELLIKSIEETLAPLAAAVGVVFHHLLHKGVPAAALRTFAEPRRRLRSAVLTVVYNFLFCHQCNVLIL